MSPKQDDGYVVQLAAYVNCYSYYGSEEALRKGVRGDNENTAWVVGPADTGEARLARLTRTYGRELDLHQRLKDWRRFVKTLSVFTHELSSKVFRDWRTARYAIVETVVSVLIDTGFRRRTALAEIRGGLADVVTNPHQDNYDVEDFIKKNFTKPN